MKITMLLADSAQSVNGKLYILGGGWSVISPGTVPMAIAIKVEVPWDQTNHQHKLTLKLVDADGRPFLVGEKPLVIEANFEVGRPPGLKPGTPMDIALAFNLLVPLPADKRFEWICYINDTTEANWKTAFTVLPDRVQTKL